MNKYREQRETAARSKAEMAEEAGVSRDTFRRWLLRLEADIPGYDRRQKVLNPAQVEYLRRVLCIRAG